MTTSFKWVEKLAPYAKPLIVTLVTALLSALGYSGLTIVEQDKELEKFRDKVVVEVTVEAPVEAPVAYDDTKTLKAIKALQTDVQTLRKWH